MKACAVKKSHYYIGEIKMKLSAPKNITFWFATVLGILGIVGTMAPAFPVIGGALGFWFLLVGFALLVFGNLLKGL